MVQTLATLLMTYKSRPSLKDCQVVSRSLHQKFKKLGDESSEVVLKHLCNSSIYTFSPFQGAWKWFIYTRSQNVNRKSCDDETSLPRKKRKVDSVNKHEYPAIPESAEDEVSNKTNLKLLQEEWAKTKGQDPQKIKTLLMRTHNIRRAEVLHSEDLSAFSILQKYPMLKRCSYVSRAFI